MLAAEAVIRWRGAKRPRNRVDHSLIRSGSRRGFREASGDINVLCEPDGTFLARDLDKLLT